MRRPSFGVGHYLFLAEGVERVLFLFLFLLVSFGKIDFMREQQR